MPGKSVSVSEMVEWERVRLDLSRSGSVDLSKSWLYGLLAV